MEVSKLEFIADCMMKTSLPNGKVAKLSPPSYTTEFLEENDFELSCSPRLGEQNEKVFGEAGLSAEEIRRLVEEQII
jgi:crotonobetainyl-CoA:carnitine CoA-transferase CaiB-like acyl-CoA transferase